MSGSDVFPKACVIVTAAGLSLRHPGKLLTDIGGQPALCRTLETLSSGGLPLVVVLPDPAALPGIAWAVELLDICRTWCAVHPGQPVTRVLNPDPARGLASSLVLGLQAAPDVESIGLCNGDRCFLLPDTVERCVRALARGPEILLPVDEGTPDVPGHPVFFHRTFLPELLELNGDMGGRHLLELHRDRVTRLPVRDPGVWQDLDGWLDSQAGKRNG